MRQFGSKNHARKISVIYKFFERYQVFMYPLYMLLSRRIDTFSSKGTDTLWSKGINKFWYRKLQAKYQQSSQKRLMLDELFMYNFLYQTIPKSKLLTIWLSQFCVITYPNLFISDLAYTTVINLILRSNINYEKLLKCDNTTNYLRKNLSYANAETVLTPSSYIFPS